MKKRPANSIKCCDISQIIPTCSFIHCPPTSVLWMYYNEIWSSDLCRSSPNRASVGGSRIGRSTQHDVSNLPFALWKIQSLRRSTTQAYITPTSNVGLGCCLVKRTWGIRRRGFDDHMLKNLLRWCTILEYHLINEINDHSAGGDILSIFTFLELNVIFDISGPLMFVDGTTDYISQGM